MEKKKRKLLKGGLFSESEHQLFLFLFSKLELKGYPRMLSMPVLRFQAALQQVQVGERTSC